MAKTKRRTRRTTANPRRRRKNSVKVIVRRRRRSNPTSHRRRRRANPVARRRVVRHHRRNPALFGRSVGAFEMAKAIAGGLAGVAITKAVPSMLPTSLLGTSPIMQTVISAAVAFAAGMAVKALVKGDSTIGDAVMFGGFMQAGSVALNAFLPSVGGYIGLRGLGDLVPGRFTVPQNPIMAGQQLALPAAAMVAAPGGGGVGAIYSPFGRAM